MDRATESFMCIFSQPVKSVSDTNLFARINPHGTQFLVYQMQFQSERINAMILPLPTELPAKEDSLRFVSFERYKNFFSDLDDGFPTRNSIADDISSARSGIVEPLAVHEVGEFIASFVPELVDFARLDPQFAIPNETWKKIPHYKNYGFAVFQLKSLFGKPHPMAFEFKTRWPEKVFFPTVHIHDGDVHEWEQFDHMLYVQHPYFDNVCGKYVNSNVKDKFTGFVRSAKKASAFCKTKLTQQIIEPDLFVHRIAMHGKRRNQDVVVDFDGKKVSWVNSAVRSIQESWLALPAAVVATGLVWLFHRRSRLNTSTEEADESKS